MPAFKNPDWLRDAVFYQVYPQSFRDTNADGIGDIPGIIEKLDYIQGLGVTAIWMNPCFVSPFQDAGYDVADYCNVAPRYGTNADLARLFREARKRGIRVCLDLVPGHTSVEHPWFKASAEPGTNEFTNRYVWTDSVWKQDVKGMRTIAGYSDRYGCYVTNFFHFQPALNFGFTEPDPGEPWQLPVDHPDVQATRREFKRIMRHWLDMGCSGFRVDMAPSLIRRDPGKKAVRAWWHEVREMFERDYPEAVLISEWGSPPDAIAAGFHMDFMLHFGPPAYNSLFRSEDGTHFFCRDGRGDIRVFMDYYEAALRRTKKGYISIPSSNHDMDRIADGRSQKDLELVFAFLLTMPGVPFIYYGDEIGMRCIRGLRSKEGGYNRTRSRTPMQWDDTANAGFSAGSPDDLYLPVDPRKARPTVAKQEGRSNSLLEAVRRLIALRRECVPLQSDGRFQTLYAEEGEYPLVYRRSFGREKVVVAINPSGRAVEASFDAPGLKPGEMLMGRGAALASDGGTCSVSLEAVSYGIFRA